MVAVLFALDRGAGTRGEASWRSLVTQPDVERVERDVRYRVRIDKAAYEPISVEALTPRANAGERAIPMREVVSLRPSDRALVELLASQSSWWRDRRGTPLESERAALVLPMLAQTGRATITVDGDEETPLEHDAGPPWGFGVTCQADGGALTVRGELVRGDEHVDLGAPRVLLTNGLVLIGQRLARVSMPSFAWVRALRERTMRIVESDVEDFAEFAATAPFSIVLPAPLRYERVVASPVLVVRIFLAGQRGLSATVAFDYDGKRAGERGPLVDRATKRMWARDEAGEKKWLDAMRAAGFRVSDLEIAIGSAKLPRAVRELMKLGARVEGERGALFRTATRFSSRVSSGIDWLDLEATAHFDGETVALPTLLAAARRGDTFVTLGDGSLAMLPEEWLARFSLYGELGDAHGDAIRFRRSQVAIVDALLEELPEIGADDAVQKLRAAVRSKPAARRPPKAFVGELRSYQSEGLGWLQFLERFGFGGCLADDMGLGKTVQVLALLAAAGGAHGRASAVARRRAALARLQLEERGRALRARAPRPRPRRHRAPPVRRRSVDDVDLVLTTYGTLRRDIDALAKMPLRLRVLDEAQAIKNRGDDRAKAARLLQRRPPARAHRHARREPPGRAVEARSSSSNPGCSARPASSSDFVKRDGAPVRDDARPRSSRPSSCGAPRRRSRAELPDAPSRRAFVRARGPSSALYDELRDHYRSGAARRRGRAGRRSRRSRSSRRCCACARPPATRACSTTSARDEPSAKLERSSRSCADVDRGGPQGAGLLAVHEPARHRARAARRARRSPTSTSTGRRATARRARRALPDDPGCPLFLISLKAGGLGLNLTAAEYVFLLDPWWNPAVEAQAIDRTHRIGQTRHVFAYRLIARDTVEERVLALQQSKRAVFESLFGDGGAIGSLTAADLDLLLS